MVKDVKARLTGRLGGQDAEQGLLGKSSEEKEGRGEDKVSYSLVTPSRAPGCKKKDNGKKENVHLMHRPTDQRGGLRL